ncbi:TetR/AcrR family transcriptional regulator [Rugosimonospora africana]|uniref:TetR family transcriptional regulator n=1 Tax=Rugosimonospora africana TaxID=556532 RepID=A0A8J3R2S1_9ACTN|nr:TetR/AcrR family transcriptional regulator [Rugosimonospora africana]GIH20729.1 TetR family transcriptional regulator [Rugosimonospora africana]
MTKDATPRRRDASASRDRLLDAARELFADRGYDRTTARDIGERAGVDPAMIARYFGGKAQLFIATLHAQDGPHPADLLDPDRLASLLERIGRHGPGPVFQAAVRPYGDPDAQDAARVELERRVVAPLRQRLENDGDPRPELRAELLIAAFIGVVLARSTGTFAHLAGASNDELLPLLQELLAPPS